MNEPPYQRIGGEPAIRGLVTRFYELMDELPEAYAARRAYPVRGPGGPERCADEAFAAFAELVEWAGTQPWSNGRVGISGVSYLTTSQWRVGAVAPPIPAARKAPPRGVRRASSACRRAVPASFAIVCTSRWGSASHRLERRPARRIPKKPPSNGAPACSSSRPPRSSPAPPDRSRPAGG